MKQPVVIIGLGEIGELFAHAFLKLGHPVFPVLRTTSMSDLAASVPDPALVLVAVTEDSLQSVLADLPTPWRSSVALVQNELLPRDWQPHVPQDPTVIVVWFDKKKGRPLVSVLPTLAVGVRAPMVVDALQRVGIPARVIDPDERLFEMVRKNLYILTINIAGLRSGGNVSELWQQHRTLATGVAHEILDIQASLAAQSLPREALIEAMVEAFEGDPQHICLGRSGPGRLDRARRQAHEVQIPTPWLDAIAAENTRPNSEGAAARPVTLA